MIEETDFNGFILPDGEMVSIQDVDRMFSLIVKHHENPDEIKESLRFLARECAQRGYHRSAYAYVEKILSLADQSIEKADCLLEMGLAMEQVQDYRAALKAYTRGLDLPQESEEIAYFLNNNTGYCLNQIGKHLLAEEFCRTAIEIDPVRHNAHKNLGVALEKLGRYVEAAKSFAQATRLCPADSRALGHLESMITDHGDLNELSVLLGVLHECYEWLEGVKKQWPYAQSREIN